MENIIELEQTRERNIIAITKLEYPVFPRIHSFEVERGAGRDGILFNIHSRDALSSLKATLKRSLNIDCNPFTS